MPPLERSFEDCLDHESICEYLKTHSNATATEYAAIALRKLRESNPFLQDRDLCLGPDQEDALRAPDLNFHTYVDALTILQLQFVGF